ncbi:MAG: tripartite tricarboxylate transporter substrate-binding protein [Burkholderiaceae bacterium]
MSTAKLLRSAAIAVCSLAAIAITPAAFAEDSKPIEWVVGYAAGCHAWQGLVLPAGASKEAVARLNKALVAALNSTPVKARFQTLALEALPGTPQQMTEFTRAERERWGKLIHANNIKLD